MLSVADSRFQAALLEQAQKAGKIDPAYRIPEAFHDNTPERVQRVIAKYRNQGVLRVFPFGSDFTETEQRLLPALQLLKRAADSKAHLLSLAKVGWSASRSGEFDVCLERMELLKPKSMTDRINRLLVLGALANSKSPG
jgi:hypothetical protein